MIEQIQIANNYVPAKMAYDSTNDYLYAIVFANGDVSSSNVTVVDTSTNSIVTSIPISGVLGGIDFNPNNNAVYVAQSSGDRIIVINATTDTIATNIVLPPNSFPNGVLFDPANGYIYVADQSSNSVSVINGLSVIDTVKVGTSPYTLGYDGANKDMYVAESNQISVISSSTNKVIQNMSGVSGYMAFAQSNQDVYVSSSGTNSLIIIDGNSNSVIGSVQNVPGSNDEQMAYDSVHAKLYVLTDQNTTSVIHTATNSVASSIVVGNAESGIAYATGGSIYVSNVPHTGPERLQVNSTIAVLCTG